MTDDEVQLIAQLSRDYFGLRRVPRWGMCGICEAYREKAERERAAADSMEAVARDNGFDLAKATPEIRREHDEALAASSRADDAAASSAPQPRDKTP